MPDPRTRMLFIPFLTSVVLVGCNSLPKTLVKRAEDTVTAITSAQKQIIQERAAYEQFMATSAGKRLERYAEREQWAAKFGSAAADIDRAKDLFEKNVRPLLKENHKKHVPTLEQELTRIAQIVRGARDKAKAPQKRYAFLTQALEQAPQLHARTVADAAAMRTATATLRTKMRRVKTDWPKKATDIDGRLAPIGKLTDDAVTLNGTVETEYARIEAEQDADLAAFADAAAKVHAYREDRQKQEAALVKRTGELYRSYSKTLTDMRTDCFITIGRASWDNWSDWDTTKNFTYPAKAVPCDTIDRYGNTNTVNESVVRTLGLDPKQSWPGGHDAAEYWVEDFDAKFFHKYVVLENGKKTETGWVEVDEEDFFDNEQNLGMDIVAKPLGLYEDEALEDAAPPGMAYVGNEKYGKWEKDPNTGHTFWHWYGQYMFFSMMFGGPRHYYSRVEYDTWGRDYRGRKAYYGGTTGKARYGTTGSVVRTSPRFSSSRFIRSGGSRSSPSTIRSAARASRGRGPGGRGK